MVHCTIVGTGDMAHALAHLFSCSSGKHTGNSLEVTKSGPSVMGTGTFHSTGVPLADLSESLRRAELVILAIPSSALRTFLLNNSTALSGKVLVDVTNSPVPGEDIQTVLGENNTQWVKAFNDIGAVDALTMKASSKSKIQTKICGPDPSNVNIVKLFAEASFGMDVKTVPYELFDNIGNQNSLGDEWMDAIWIMGIVFLITEIYAIFRYNVFEEVPWYHLPLKVTNKACCWSALNGFAIAQLPGTLARLMNAGGASPKVRPSWLLTLLRCRKQLGLVALWFLGVHMVMSAMLFNPVNYGKLFEKDMAGGLSAMGEAALFFGIIGTSLFVVMGICSLPSVAIHMTNRSWHCVYGPVAWFALLCGTAHPIIMGVPGWMTPGKWAGGMPPITMMSAILPLFVIVLKLVQTFKSACVGKKKSRDMVGDVALLTNA